MRSDPVPVDHFGAPLRILLLALAMTTGAHPQPPPWIVAHRGASATHPENTLRAFRAAIRAGAPWLECDVFRSADGELVVIHDARTGRVADRDLAVGESTLAALRELDVAHAFRAAHELSLEDCPPARIPTLAELLDLVASDDDVHLTIQPKDDSTAAAVSLVNDRGLAARCACNDGDLAKMRSARRDLATGGRVFWDRPADLDLRRDLATAVEQRFDALVLHHRAVDRATIARIQGAGLRAGAWTVNDRSHLAELLALGIDLVYTDRPSVALDASARARAFHDRVTALRDAQDLPSLAAGVVQGGRLTLAAVVGTAGGGQAATLDTRYRAASITKTLTATLLATLAADGVVALDDPLAEHLPAQLTLPDGAEAITLARLASHRSGLPRMPRHLPGGRPDEPYGAPDHELLLAALQDAELTHAPGTRVAYSNLGYALLGLALARAAEQPYAPLLDSRVLQPLGMHDSWIGDPEAGSDHVARGFRGPDPERDATPWRLGAFAPAGGLVTTLPDLCRYAAAHLRAAHGATDVPLAGPLRTTHAVRQQNDTGRGITLGWMTIDRGEHGTRLWHNGAVGGFRSLMLIDPTDDRAVVLLTNRGYAAGPDPLEAVMADLLHFLAEHPASGR